MNHLFVPYELAKCLKEKGFNEPCFTYWFTVNGKNPQLRKSDIYFYGYKNRVDSNTIAPLYQQVQDWFIIKHQIHLSPQIDFDGDYWVQIKQSNLPNMKIDKWYAASAVAPYKTQNEALDSAIKEALKLI